MLTQRRLPPFHWFNTFFSTPMLMFMLFLDVFGLYEEEIIEIRRRSSRFNSGIKETRGGAAYATYILHGSDSEGHCVRRYLYCRKTKMGGFRKTEGRTVCAN